MLPLLWITAAAPGFFAGAAQVDVTPTLLPVIVNCGFAERTASKITSRVYAKALVLGEGETKLAIAIVDSCMMPRPLLDRAKAIATGRTGIPADRMLIAATHTHSAPSAHACLGSDEQPGYGDFLAGQIAEAIALAHERRQPAQLGSAAVDDAVHTHSRRFLYRAEHALTDPFGQKSVFANMHPGYEHPQAVGPAGPVDPALTVLSVQTRSGQPIAVLANYSMHYFGSAEISADYAGVFAAQLKERLRAPEGFVAIMSQGTSGDLHWMDYAKPKVERTIDEYTAGVVDSAMRALGRVRYAARGPLEMGQGTLTAVWRRPDAARLAWARERMEKLGGAKPKSQPDVYAREAVMLAEKPAAELMLQALRIGDLAVAAMPNEVFGLTGLKLKARSPLGLTMNIELANGAEGYIPPPEQHALGGYTTWPARSAGLAVDTEPRVVEAMLRLLQRVTGAPRRTEVVTPGAYARAVQRSRPEGYWPMEDLDGETVRGRGGALRYEGKHALFLEGVEGRAAYLLQGRLLFPFARPVGDHTLEMWVWSAESRRWQHQAAVCRQGALTLYVDAKAQPIATCPVGGDLFPAAVEGKVDEVAFYRRALRAGEIERHVRARP